MNIQRHYTAIVGATIERRFITKASKQKALDPFDKKYCELLIKTSGPSVHAPNKVIRNWIKAYQHNLERVKMIEHINKPFQNQSFIAKAFNKLTKHK